MEGGPDFLIGEIFYHSSRSSSRSCNFRWSTHFFTSHHYSSIILRSGHSAGQSSIHKKPFCRSLAEDLDCKVLLFMIPSTFTNFILPSLFMQPQHHYVSTIKFYRLCSVSYNLSLVLDILFN